MTMWIEVLSRHGDVSTRVRVTSDEARIGRAFDNDVVVDDPHVAPHHARIYRAEDGELVAEDLGTLNGLYPEHGAHRATRVLLAKEPGLRMGRTIVRVRDAAHGSAIRCEGSEAGEVEPAARSAGTTAAARAAFAPATSMPTPYGPVASAICVSDENDTWL